MATRNRFLPLRIVLSLALVASLTGCASMSTTQKGAVIGAATGGVAGGIIGKQTGSTTRGVLIGAVIGGIAGGLIGRAMDQQAKELEQNIPGATVQRVGEGIAVTFDSGLMFDFDSDVIRGDARSNLNALANSLDKYPKSNLMIVGHTDAVGPSSYNLDLSERRAASAASYLASRGVSRDRIATRGVGETEPIASNETEGGRHENRRVEVAIYASEEWRAEAQRQAGTN